MNWKLTLTYNHMANLKEPTKITGWEKWINRIVTAALAVWQAVQYLLTHWQNTPTQ